MDDEEFLVKFRISTCQTLNLGPWETAPDCLFKHTCKESKRCLEEAKKVLGMSKFLASEPKKQAG